MVLSRCSYQIKTNPLGSVQEILPKKRQSKKSKPVCSTTSKRGSSTTSKRGSSTTSKRGKKQSSNWSQEGGDLNEEEEEEEVDAEGEEVEEEEAEEAEIDNVGSKRKKKTSVEKKKIRVDEEKNDGDDGELNISGKRKKIDGGVIGSKKYKQHVRDSYSCSDDDTSDDSDGDDGDEIGDEEVDSEGYFDDEDHEDASDEDEDNRKDAFGDDKSMRDNVCMKGLKSLEDATRELEEAHKNPKIREDEEKITQALRVKYGELLSIPQSSHTLSSQLSQQQNGLASMKAKVKRNKDKKCFLYIVIPGKKLCGGRFVKLGLTNSPKELPSRYLTYYGEAKIVLHNIPKLTEESGAVYRERVGRLEQELFNRVSPIYFHSSNRNLVIISSFSFQKKESFVQGNCSRCPQIGNNEKKKLPSFVWFVDV